MSSRRSKSDSRPRIVDFPIEILRIIFLYEQSPRARWGHLATLRLVCRRFRHAIPPALLRDALLKDFSEFPAICVSDPNYDTFMHFYVLIHPQKIEGEAAINLLIYSGIWSRCKFQHPSNTGRTTATFLRDKIDKECIRVAFGAELYTWRHKLYQMCLHTASTDPEFPSRVTSAVKFWYALSSAYHIYFKSIKRQPQR